MTDFRDASWWDVSSEDYYASTLPGYSYLSQLLSGKPAPKRSTTDFGNAGHVAVLQPDRMADLVVTKPDDVDVPREGSELRSIVDLLVRGTLTADDLVVIPDDCKRGNGCRARKEAWEKALPPRAVVVSQADKERAEKCAAWLASTKGRYVITEQEHDDLMTLSVAVTEHPATQRMWGHSAARREQAVTGVDSVTGIRCRTRLDHLIGAKSSYVISDLKFTHDPDPEGAFYKHAFEFGYHIQAALCCEIVEAIPSVGCCPGFNWMACSDSPPARIAFIPCTEEWLELGRADLRSALMLEEVRREREWKRVPRPYEGIATPIGPPALWMKDEVARRRAHAERCRKDAGR